MDNGINHILNVAGILKNFSIAKKITPSELLKIKKRAKDKCTSSDDYTEILKQEILSYTDDYIKHNKIPGLIVNKKNGLKSFKLKDPAFIKLYKEAAKAVKQLDPDKALSKREMIFFIMSLVGIMELSQSDFNKFNKEVNLNSGLEEDDSEDDDDDSDEWGSFGDFNVT